MAYNTFEEEERRRRRQEYLNRWQSQRDQQAHTNTLRLDFAPGQSSDEYQQEQWDRSQRAMQQGERDLVNNSPKMQPLSSNNNQAMARVDQAIQRVADGTNYEGYNARQNPNAGITYEHALAKVDKAIKKAQTDSTYDALINQNMQPVVYNTWNYPISEEAKQRAAENRVLNSNHNYQDEQQIIANRISALPEDQQKELQEIARQQDLLNTQRQLTQNVQPTEYQLQDINSLQQQINESKEAMKKKYGLNDDQLGELMYYATRQQNEADVNQIRKDIYDSTHTGSRAKDYLGIGLWSAASVMSSPRRGLDALIGMKTQDMDENRPEGFSYDYNGEGFGAQALSNAVVEGSGNRIAEGRFGEAGRGVYQAAYAAAESAMNNIATAPYLPELGLKNAALNEVANRGIRAIGMVPNIGLNAYTQGYQNAKAKGLSDDAAKKTGLMEGFVEILTETISPDILTDAAKGKFRVLRKPLVSFLTDVGVEGAEEAIGELLTTAGDYVLNKGQSDYEQAVQRYMSDPENPMTEEEARSKARWDVVGNIAEAFAGGALSTVFGSAVGTGVTLNEWNRESKQYYPEGTDFASILQQERENAPTEWENESAKRSYDVYMAKLEEIANKQANGEKITNKDRRNLFWNLRDAYSTEYETREESGSNERMRQEAAQREEEARKAAEEEEKNRITFEQYDDGIEITDLDGNPIQQEQPAAPARPWAREENSQSSSTPYQQEALGRDEITKRLAEAQSPTELATVYQQVQDSGNTEDIDYLRQVFPTYTSRMVSEIEDEGERIQSLDVINRMAMDGTLTQQRAYQAGLEGREINPDEMSDEIKLAYNDGQIANREAAAAETRAFRDTVESMRMPAMQDSFIAHYNGDMPVQQYNRVFSNIFEAGRQIDTENQTPEQIAEKLEKTIHNSGTAISLMAYTDMDGNEYSGPQVAEQIFNDAIKAARQDRADVLLRENAKTITAKGTGEFQDLRRNPSSRQDLRPLNGIAKLTGISIKVMDRADFIKTSGGADANGFFNQKTGELILNGDSGRIVTTALHEIGEFADAFNTNEFRSVVQATQSTLQDVLGLENYRALRSPYLNGYTINADGSTVSYNTFTESDVDKEITNDVIWRILGNEDLLTALGNNIDRQVEDGKLSTQQAKSIRQKISDFIRKVFDGLKNLVSGGGRKPGAESLQGTYGKLTTAGETKMSGFQSAAANIEELEQHRDALISAIRGAVLNYQGAKVVSEAPVDVARADLRNSMDMVDAAGYETRTMPALRLDPVVMFTGTDEQISQYEQARDDAASEWKQIIENPTFDAMQIDLGRGRTLILSPSIRGGLYQLTNVQNGEPTSHSLYGDTAGSSGMDYWHPMRELYDELVDFQNSRNLEIEVMSSDPQNMTKEDVLQKIPNGTRFSMTMPVEQTKDYIAIHNLSEGNLMKDFDLGGFPMPSIAVTKASIGHTKFGEISVLFRKDTVDPKADKRNKIYGADAWTPTFPRVEYEINDGVVDSIKDRIDKVLGSLPDEYKTIERLALLDEGTLNSVGGYRGLLERYENDTALKAVYLAEQGKHIQSVVSEKVIEMPREAQEKAQAILDAFGPSISEWGLDEVRKNLGQTKDVLYRYWESKIGAEKAQEEVNGLKGFDVKRSIIEAKKLLREGPRHVEKRTDLDAMKEQVERLTDQRKYREWLKNLFTGIEKSSGVWNGKDYLTSAGNRRSFAQLHMPITAENIVKAMIAQNDDIRNAEGFHGSKSIRAVTTEDFASLEAVKKSGKKLQTIDDEAYNEYIRGLDDRLSQIITEIANASNYDAWEAMDHVGSIILDASRRKKVSPETVSRDFKPYLFKLSTEQARTISDLINEIKEMPVNMFEAKPLRVVTFGEIASIVLPDTASAEIREEIEKRGIPYLEYKHDNEENRKHVVNSVEGARFSRNVDSMGRGLTADQQSYFENSKVRNESGNLMVMYHGTPSGGFTVFRNDLTFFTPDREYADKYRGTSASARRSGKTATEPQTYEVYLNIEHPFDIRDPKTRKRFINEYVKGGYALGINPYTEYRDTTRTGLPDWTEADNIYEWMEENDLLGTYDGILVDEGGYPDGNGSVADRGIAYITFNQDQIKNVDNLHPTHNPDIRYSKQVDSEGNKLTENQAQYFADSKLRDENGNLMLMYHGSEAAGFNTFSRKKSPLGFFFSDHMEQAQSYSGSDEVYDPNKQYSFEELKNITDGLRLGAFVKRVGGGYNFARPGQFLEFKTLKEAQEHILSISSGVMAGNYRGYLNVTDPLEIDAHGVEWWSIPYRGKVYNTDTLAAMAERMGKDGLIIRNVIDYGESGATNETPSTIAVVFSPEQIKDAGNQNPTTNPDIRYSKKVDISADEIDEIIRLATNYNPDYWMMEFGDYELHTPNGTKHFDTIKDLQKYIVKNIGATSIGDLQSNRVESYDLLSHLLEKENAGWNIWETPDGYEITQPNGDATTYSTLAQAQKYIMSHAAQINPKYANAQTSSGAEDSQGNELSRKQEKYFKNSKVRDENGKLLVMYHGTTEVGFTVFDPQYSRDNLSLFFTDSPEVAASYSASTEDFIPDKVYSFEEMASIVDRTTEGDYELTQARNGSYDMRPVDGGETHHFKTLPDVMDYIVNQYMDNAGNYNVYLNLENPMVINWEELSEAEKQEMASDGHVQLTRDYAKIAKDKGYDGVIFKNIVDIGLYSDIDKPSTVAVAFNSNQVKSVANKNPTSNPDIRYSRRIAEEVSEDELLEAINRSGGRGDYFAYHSGYGKYLLEYYDEDGNQQSKWFTTRKEAYDFVGREITPFTFDQLDGFSGKVTADTLNEIMVSETYGHGWVEETFNNRIVVFMDDNRYEFRSAEDAAKYLADNKDAIRAAAIPTDANGVPIIDTEGQTLSPGQQEFFRDSKVRDAQGALITMYKGAGNAGYTVFSRDRSEYGVGWFFTSSKGVAYGYAPNSEEFIPEEMDEELRGIDVSEWELSEPGDYDDYDPESGYSQSQNYVVRTPSRDYEFKTHQAAVNFIRDAAAGYRPGIYKVYLNLKNPLVVDAEFNDWRYIPFEGNRMSTDQIAEVAKERGYDGMIIKNVEDTTAAAYERYSTVAQAFEQNQIKSVANLNPTDDPDIRKSVDLSGLDDFEDGSIESIYRDQELASILRQGSEALKGQKVDSKLVNKIAGEILKKYKSAYDRKTLADNLEKLFAYAQEKNRIDYEDLSKVIREVARPVVDGVTEKVGTKEYKAFMDILRSRKIALTDRQKAEVASHSGSYGAFVKSMRGISFSSNGTPLDSMWSELVDASGGFLDPDAAEGDMPILLQQAMHDLTPYAANTFQGDADDVAANLAMEIIERYYEEAGKAQSDATLKQKLKEASDKMKKEAEEFRQTVRREYEERLKEARKEQQERSNRKRREGKYTQKDMDEAIAKMRARNKRQYEKQKDAEQQRYQKQQVMNAANKLLNMLINPTPKAHVPEALQEPVLDLLTSINFLTPTITRTKDGKYQTKILVSEKDETGKVKRRWETFIADNVADVIGAFQESLENTANGSKDQRKWNEKLRGVKDLYSQAVTPNSELSFTLRDFLEGLDQSLAADLDAIIANRNGAVAISMLNAEELKTINKVLRNIMASINKIDKLYSDPESINGVHGLAEQTMAHANSLLKNRKTKDRRRTTRGAKTFLTLDNATPETFMHAIGESGERIYRMLTKAQNTKAFDLRHAQEYMIGDGSTDKEGRYNSGILKGVSQKELSEWSGDKAKIVYDGGNMKLTVADLMYLYELQKRKDAESHKYGGFEAADKIINGKVHQDTTPHYMSSETISEITDLLTERQKEIADDMQKFLAVECSAWGNDVSMLLYGYEKFTDPNYIPMSVDKRTTRISNEQVGEGLINTIKNQGFTKALIPNASNPLIIMDIFDVFTNHVTGMAAYHAYAAPITDIIRWDNFKAIDEIEGFDGEKYGRYNTVKESLQTIFGDDGQTYLVRLVQDLNNQEKRTEVGASRIQSLMGNYKSAATLANLRVVMQQPTAWLRAGEVIDYKWLAEGLKPNAAAADLQERTSAISWVKSQGNIDGYITQSMKATITGAQTWRDRINGAAGYLAGKADDVTWAALYRAVYAEQKAAHDGKTNTVDFELAVNRRFDELIARTQVVDGTLMRSQMMRSKDGMNTVFSAFMAEPTKSYNMFLRDYFDIIQGRDKTGKVRKDDLKHLSRTLVAYLLTNIINAVAQSLADAARDEKEDKNYWQKFLEAYPENLLNDLNMLNNIPIVKDFYAVIEKGMKKILFNETSYSSGSGDMLTDGMDALFTAIGNMMNQSDKTKKTPYGLSTDLISAVSKLSGVPAYNLMRDVVAIWNTVNDFWGGKNIRRTKATTAELTGNAMDTIETSIRTGSDYKAAIEESVKRGATYDQIERKITETYKPEYLGLLEQGKKSEATTLENRLLMIYEYLDKQEGQKSSKKTRVREWAE